MPITLGPVTFDALHTTVREKLEEVGGRDERRIRLSGLIAGETSIDAIESRMDAILEAASPEGFHVSLTLRAGRRLWVRREAFDRELRPEALVGAFTLDLEARDPFEESGIESTLEWTVEESGAAIAVATLGNTWALPVIAITAMGELINPSVSDGERTVAFEGVLPAGQSLNVNGQAGCVLRGEIDVTPYTSGQFPRIGPESTVLTYNDHDDSSHAAAITLSWRDRWW